MHPDWFRIGGVAQDLPAGLGPLVRDFLDYLPQRLDEYDKMVMQNRIFKARTQGRRRATRWRRRSSGASPAPGCAPCGFDWDFRKKRPYSGYEQFEFDVPLAQQRRLLRPRAGARRGDAAEPAHHRAVPRQHAGRPLQGATTRSTTPPLKERTMHDIETLITHFLSVSWGPVMPPGEASSTIEATKGANSYYLISDGDTMPYRTRIRTPSFPHMQMLPLIIPRARWSPTCSRSSAASISCWRTSIDEGRWRTTARVMLSSEEIAEIEARTPQYPDTRAAASRR